MDYASIGVASYRGAQRVDWCIQSIKKFSTNEGIDYRIVVYDDGTPDNGNSFRQVCNKHNVPLIRSDENHGISYGWNKVSHYYDDAEILVVLNDDIIIQPDWLKCMSYFLRNNPDYFACGWPIFWIEEEEMIKVLNCEKVISRDPISRVPRPDWENKYTGLNRPGRIMAAIGCCFAYLRTNFFKVGNFDERYKSFFEESKAGTLAAQMGMPSSGLSWPGIYHIWGKTFGTCPELKAHERMQASRKMYIDDFQVPQEFWGDPPNCPFDYTNPKFMSKIPRKLVKWMLPDGSTKEEWDEGIVEHT